MIIISVLACYECSILIRKLSEVIKLTAKDSNCLLCSGCVTPVSAVRHLTHPPQPSSPSARPPDSRLQEQLRSPLHCDQAVKGETCHRSPAVWRHSCTESSGCEKLWRTGLWAAVVSSAARRVFFPSASSLNWTKSEEVSSEKNSATLFCVVFVLSCVVNDKLPLTRTFQW